MIEEETKALTKVGETYSNNVVIIPIFDNHSKNIINGNGARRITANAYKFRYHPENSNIFKALLERCSDNINNAFNFVPFGLPQLTTITTYRHYIKLQKNYLVSISIILSTVLQKAQWMTKLKNQDEKKPIWKN